MQLSSVPPPVLPPDAAYCMFLDLDGTLVDIAPTPAEVQLDASLVNLLAETAHLLDGALAIVSGRSIEGVDALLQPLLVAASGLHGYERRSVDGSLCRPFVDLTRLGQVRSDLVNFVADHPGLLMEDKSVGVAVHFRAAPHLAVAVREYLRVQSLHLGSAFGLLEGDAVIEIKPVSHNKATAVDAYMREEPFRGRFPIYIGDDHTDQDGFGAVTQRHGMAIAVGNRVSTQWRLRDPAAVTAWLTDFNNMSVRAA
jgi:trehalose 6-phosphate phosphatase